MRKLIFVVLLVALAAPIAAFADGAPTPASTANQICKQAQKQMDPTLFAQTYAPKGPTASAFGKCVSANASKAQQDVSDATKTCKAEQADPNFPASHDGKTFDQFYGSNTSKGKGASANAYGKCVSRAVSRSVSAQSKSLATAAKTCKAVKKNDPTGFAGKYGSGKNALGKCVATTSKTK